MVNYGLVSYNFRSIALGHTGHIAVTTFLVATMAYVVIRKVSQKQNSIHSWLGYSLGGVIGNLLGLEISKLF